MTYDVAWNRELPLPTLCDARPVSLARWRKHRATMLAECRPGVRPPELWVYEKEMPAGSGSALRGGRAGRDRAGRADTDLARAV